MKTNEQLDKEAYPAAFFVLVGAIVWGILLAVSWANAAEQTRFSWSPNTETDLAGYNLYYGPSTGNYTTIIDCGLPVTADDGRVYYTIDTPFDGDLFYSLTAYDSGENESDFATEISDNPPPGVPGDFRKEVTINITIN